MVILFAVNKEVAIVTIPTDLNPGDQYRLVFVTSTTCNAVPDDIADYNAFVTGAATAVTALNDLCTTWRAIGSTDAIDARDNTGTNPGVSTGVPIYRLDDTCVADNNADLWDGGPFDAVQNPISLTQLKTTIIDRVWSGSSADGTGFPGFTLSWPSVLEGLTDVTNEN